MGCFNTIRVPCPKCQTIAHFQTKGGDRSMSSYDLADAPLEDLSDVNRHAPYTCEQCGTSFEVKVQVLATVVLTS